MFNPTDKLSITLEAQQWNSVVALVAAEFQRAQFITQLMQDLQAQLQEKTQPPPDNVIPMGDAHA